MLSIGVDLGGTKTSIVVLDRNERICYSERCATPNGSYQGTLELVAAMVGRAEREAGPAATVGIGTPGTPGAKGRMRNANSVCLNGMPLKTDLEQLLGRAVAIANDANCFALSEATDGAGAGAPSVFGVILGTGVGAGIVLGGRLVEGVNHIAGEWGHNPLAPLDPGESERPACYCGRTGCVEAYLSGPGMAKDYKRTTGAVYTASQIVQRALAETPVDAAARLVLARYKARLARALASVINILDPHVIVLGGGLSQIESLYEDVPRLWREHVFSDTVQTVLRRAAHGDDSGVRGAAWLGRALAPGAAFKADVLRGGSS